MKKILINSNRFFLKRTKVNEGGISRNNAWYNFANKNENCKILTLSSSKLISTIQLVFFLLFIKNKEIIFLYPTVGMPILNNSFVGKKLTDIFIALIKKANKKNKIIFDICDLKYEQAIDLSLDYYDIDYLKNVEEKIFGLNIHFIFASKNMRNYAIKKYKLSMTNTYVCPNGSIKLMNIENNEKKELINQIDEKKINYIYAGTLNKGRFIEEMINNFPENENIYLYLCGVSGDWIDNCIKERNNIKYLGALSEETAHQFTSKCDIGLIPYDDNKLYYNIAYPTKLSFYITAGIPYLSTPVAEVINIQEKYQIGFVCKISEWKKYIRHISKEDVQKRKELAKTYSNNFLWEYIFNDFMFMYETKKAL